MFQSVKELMGYSIQASDGEVGRIKDFYFDAESWIIRYLVVETGTWLAGREILLSPAAVDPGWQDQPLRVKLSREQVEQSPEVDAVLPVSRQHEADLHAYYRWPAYWTDGGLFDTGRAGEASRDRVEPDRPNLRSVREVRGYNIQARDGEIGHIEDFIFDDETWTLQYMIVDTGGWLPGKQVLLAPSWVARVNWASSELEVDLTRETIQNSPAYDSMAALNREYETRLHDHYNRPKYWR